MSDTTKRILTPTEAAINGFDPTIPFSLTCVNCDDGQNVDSAEQANLLGWTDIEADDGMSWNYLGVCPNPECKRQWSLT